MYKRQTLFFILYFGRRVPGYSFERTVMMFGTCTGTIPTGLILLLSLIHIS